MIFKQRNKEVNTNLGGHSFENLLSGNWQIGFFSDNIGLKDKENDKYYKTVTIKDNSQNKKHRCLKNKVPVKLLDGSTVKKHIIHWVESENYFCITNDIFWDKLSIVETK